MLGYIGRRLLLMIPTLLGITFLVFMLLALAPGGIGAALRAAGGNVDADSKASLQLLYIEDRYGLDDHELVQYGRWLASISPLKFDMFAGGRAQRNYAGDLEQPPREVKDIPIDAAWFGVEIRTMCCECQACESLRARQARGQEVCWEALYCIAQCPPR